MEILLKRKFNQGNKLLIWEFTRSSFFYIPEAARMINVKVIALPHNIESLVPNQGSAISGKKAPDWFNEEIRYLSFCSLVFCISKEDTNLLNLFGLNAFYLPYYPTRDVEYNLLGIREKRFNRIKEKNHRTILMLGSADNQPTRLGMIDRIKIFNKNTFANIELIIAGFNTELLNSETNISSNTKILGTLGSDQLEKLLSEVDILLIHQPPTTGSLTKIPEMLIAGIPVLANFSSARDYYNSTGLYVYDDDETFYEIINKFEFTIPVIPERPVKESKSFIDKVKLLNE